MMPASLCTICPSPYRSDIELLMKKGYNNASIARIFWKEFSDHFLDIKAFEDHVRNHKTRKHLPDLATLKLKIIQEHGEEKVKASLRGQETPFTSTSQPQRPIPSTQSPEPEQKEKPISVEEYAQRILERGLSDSQMKKLSPSVIIQAQKLLIDKDKIKTQHDALKIAMFKMMSGLLKEEDVPPITLQDEPIS